MNPVDVSSLARYLLEVQGAKAIPEAVRKAASFESAGDREQSKIWRQVEAVLWEWRGPHES